MFARATLLSFVFSALLLSADARMNIAERDGRALQARRFGKQNPEVLTKLRNACGGGVCATLAGEAITGLLADSAECAQQDIADKIVDAAKKQTDAATQKLMIDLAKEYRQAEKNTPPDFSVQPPALRNSVFCQKAPKNAELEGLNQAQDPANDPELFFDPATKATVKKGEKANTEPLKAGNKNAANENKNQNANKNNKNQNVNNKNNNVNNNNKNENKNENNNKNENVDNENKNENEDDNKNNVENVENNENNENNAAQQALDDALKSLEDATKKVEDAKTALDGELKKLEENGNNANKNNNEKVVTKTVTVTVTAGAASETEKASESSAAAEATETALKNNNNKDNKNENENKKEVENKATVKEAASAPKATPANLMSSKHTAKRAAAAKRWSRDRY